MASMNGDNDDASTSEPPLSDFDPFGIRQIMLPVVSFRSSAKVNAHHEIGRDRGSRSRRALKNKVQASSFALHQAYWERSSCTSNLYLRKRESPAPELSLSSSWEDIEFDDDDSALFAPDIENSSTISDDDAPLSISSVRDAGEKLRSMRFIAECPKLLEHLQSGKSTVDRASYKPFSISDCGIFEFTIAPISPKKTFIHPLVLQMQTYSKGPAHR